MERICNKVANTISEKIPESLLDLYLSDMKKYTFSFQVIVARERIRIYKEASENAKSGYVVFIDRGLWGRLCFCKYAKTESFFYRERI